MLGTGQHGARVGQQSGVVVTLEIELLIEGEGKVLQPEIIARRDGLGAVDRLQRRGELLAGDENAGESLLHVEARVQRVAG